MAHLIDIGLVTLAVGGAVFVSLRYLVGLLHPDHEPTSAHCAGCKESCQVRDLTLEAGFR